MEIEYGEICGKLRAIFKKREKNHCNIVSHIKCTYPEKKNKQKR